MLYAFVFEYNIYILSRKFNLKIKRGKCTKNRCGHFNIKAFNDSEDEKRRQNDDVLLRIFNNNNETFCI